MGDAPRVGRGLRTLSYAIINGVTLGQLEALKTDSLRRALLPETACVGWN